MSFGFQGNEWLIILIIVLLLFGPKKLPELARGLGKALYEFKRASQGLIEEEEEKSGKEEKAAEAKSEKLAEKMGAGEEKKAEAKA